MSSNHYLDQIISDSPKTNLYGNADFQRSIEEISNEAIYRMSLARGIVFVNEVFSNIFECVDSYQVLGLRTKDFLKNDKDATKLEAYFRRNCSVMNLQLEFVKRDGSSFWGLLNCQKITVDNEVYYDGVIKDIDAQKNTLDALSYQNGMHEVITKISGDYVNVSMGDIDSSINSSLAKMGEFLKVDRVHIHDYDYERNECVTLFEWCGKGVSPTIVNHQKIPLDTIVEIMQVHTEGEHILIEDVDLLPEGLPKKVLQSQSVKCILTVPTLLEGKCVGFAGFDVLHNKREFAHKEISLLKLFADMTVSALSRSKSERRINNLLERTSIQNKRLRDFSFITSHNIRSGAANIGSIINLMKVDPLDSHLLEMLDDSMKKLDLSLESVDEILDIENNMEFKETEKCNLVQFVRKSLFFHKSSILSKEVEVVDNLPYRLFVNAIPTYLDSIFNHIITNALRYGIGGKSKKIMIDYANHNKEIIVRVKDFGSGLDTKKFGKQLFQIGARFHPESCNNLGMGLFISRYQIQAMGGKIEIKSEVDRGCSVELTFPK